MSTAATEKRQYISFFIGFRTNTLEHNVRQKLARAQQYIQILERK